MMQKVPARPIQSRVIVGLVGCAVGISHLAISSRYHGPLRAFVTGYLIDILLPFALFLLLGLFPYALLRQVMVRALPVFAIGALAETLQGFGIPLAGSTFDPLDYVAYAVGVTAGIVFEALVLYRKGRIKPSPRADLPGV